MDIRDLSTGEKIAGVAAIVLFVLMFFTWFSTPDVPDVLGFDEDAVEQAQQQAEDLGITLPDVDTDIGFNAFESFDVIDLLLLLTVIAGLSLAGTAAMNATPNLPVALSAIVTGVALLTAVLVLYRIIDPPGGLDRSIWLFVGFLATVGVAAGGWLAMQDEGASFTAAGGQIGDQFGGGQQPPPAPGQAPPAPPPPQQQPPPPPPPAAGGSQPPPPPPPPPTGQ